MGVLARGRRAVGGQIAEWVFTDRMQGASASPYDQANLGRHVGDDPASVDENRRLLARTLDLSDHTHLVTMEQVHGSDVAVIDRARGEVEAPPRADGLITDTAGVALVTQVADCVPVVLATDDGWIAAVHSGWRGVVAGVVDATIAQLRQHGSTGRIHAWIGPAICPGCYEVGEDVRAEVTASAPAAFATTRWDTPAVDVVAAVAEQLAHHDSDVEIIPGCTFEDPRLFSYRRDGVTGRQAGAIVLRHPDSRSGG